MSSTVSSQQIIRAGGVATVGFLALTRNPVEFAHGALLGAASAVTRLIQGRFQTQQVQHKARPSGGCASGLTELLTGQVPSSETEIKIRAAFLMTLYYRWMSKSVFALSASLDFARPIGVALVSSGSLKDRIRPLLADSWPVKICRIVVLAFAFRDRPKLALLGLASGIAAGVAQAKWGNPYPSSCCCAKSEDTVGCSNNFINLMTSGMELPESERLLRSSLLLALHLRCKHLGRLFVPMATFDALVPIGKALSSSEHSFSATLRPNLTTACSVALCALAAWRHRFLALAGAGAGLLWGVIDARFQLSSPAMAVPGGCAKDFRRVMSRGDRNERPLVGELKNLATVIGHVATIPRMSSYVAFDFSRATLLRVANSG